MVKFLVTLWIFSVGVSGEAQTPSASPFPATNYVLQWEYKDIPFQFKVYEAPSYVHTRLWETKEIKSLSELPLMRELSKGEVKVNAGGSVHMFLVAQNTTKKEINFGVAPHSTDPIESALGFSFKCLCNGHVYKVSPGNYWYRIIKIQTNSSMRGDRVQLKHIVFAVSKK